MANGPVDGHNMMQLVSPVNPVNVYDLSAASTLTVWREEMPSALMLTLKLVAGLPLLAGIHVTVSCVGL